MSQEFKSEDLPEPTERRVWETPSLTRLDTEDAQVAAGVGPDYAVYS